MRLCRYSKNENIVDVALFLIEKCINVNQKDEEGRNASYHLRMNNSFTTDYNRTAIAKLLQQ